MSVPTIASSKVVAVLLALPAALATTPTAGVIEVIHMRPDVGVVPLLMMVSSLTALTFIAVLLACGMREPLL
jgi:hypothetical protein